MIKKIINSAIQGLFWVLPITAIIFIIYWLFGKVNGFADYIFNLFGFDPKQYEIVWTIFVVLMVTLILSVVGFFASTRLAIFVEKIVTKIPFYKTLKDIIGIFNSSKQENNSVLVVAISGFTQKGYNIGLMYSTKESIIKDHYTVSLSMSPIPNGGFMFEVHKDDIFVIEKATFNDNLNYLLSMGTKSLTEILERDAQSKLISFNDYIQQKGLSS